MSRKVVPISKQIEAMEQNIAEFKQGMPRTILASRVILPGGWSIWVNFLQGRTRENKKPALVAPVSTAHQQGGWYANAVCSQRPRLHRGRGHDRGTGASIRHSSGLIFGAGREFAARSFEMSHLSTFTSALPTDRLLRGEK